MSRSNTAREYCKLPPDQASTDEKFAHYAGLHVDAWLTIKPTIIGGEMIPGLQAVVLSTTTVGYERDGIVVNNIDDLITCALHDGVGRIFVDGVKLS
jgi:hypothetical protein